MPKPCLPPHDSSCPRCRTCRLAWSSSKWRLAQTEFVARPLSARRALRVPRYLLSVDQKEPEGEAVVFFARNDSTPGTFFCCQSRASATPSHRLLAPHTSGPRDVPRFGALSLFQKDAALQGGSAETAARLHVKLRVLVVVPGGDYCSRRYNMQLI
jgi:hypothetical protein